MPTISPAPVDSPDAHELLAEPHALLQVVRSPQGELLRCHGDGERPAVSEAAGSRDGLGGEAPALCQPRRPVELGGQPCRQPDPPEPVARRRPGQRVLEHVDQFAVHRTG